MKKYVLAGAGHRGLHMYARPLFENYGDTVLLAGIFDINRTRAEYVSRECGNIPVYPDFDKMLLETGPDGVIVTTADSFHHDYIIKALHAGCDVISEKPLTIDAEKCRRVLEAEKKTGQKIVVTFNVRFMPFVYRIKELLKEGAIGRVLSVDLEWVLDTRHGADYFRRWHRYMAKSGGLLVHKSTHHFDMINWWLEDYPEEVHAFGDLKFYGSNGAHRGDRCRKCRYRGNCGFYWDICSNEFTKSFYFDAEKDDGYIRDGCVFADDIDIFDTVAASVRYRNGALLTYSFNAYSPYEGWKVKINGMDGRIEAEDFISGLNAKDKHQHIRIFNRRGEIINYSMDKSDGGHGGGDERLLRMIFGEGAEDPMGCQADSTAGAMSMLTGAAANVSIREKRPVLINELLK